MKDLALKISAVIFLLVSIMHMFRLFYKTEVIIGCWRIPMWVSIFGSILPLFLSVWIFTLLALKKK